MPNQKISQLTAVTTPLAGTEELPVVQSSTTKKATVNNINDKLLQTANTFTQTQNFKPTANTTAPVAYDGVLIYSDSNVVINASGTITFTIANSNSGARRRGYFKLTLTGVRNSATVTESPAVVYEFLLFKNTDNSTSMQNLQATYAYQFTTGSFAATNLGSGQTNIVITSPTTTGAITCAWVLEIVDPTSQYTLTNVVTT